ncbi:unnamed protein product [Acanthoscelides obtectus]|uniref:Uncharacterized protein n=1 Tax=Acanthoscelides obtectus TaxID=200917 RepID=A0A9P0Q4X6_ACAOB|nr:unnamed protein product [Acanthoscelides obtectus]CAK1681746.1 hypothetical protein AOBTE_LOCUS33260 [Acanthoscelides obtectus]
MLFKLRAPSLENTNIVVDTYDAPRIVLNINTDNSKIIELYVGRTYTCWLIDSRAAVSLVKSEVVERLNLPVAPDDHRIITDISGNVIQKGGSARVRFNLGFIEMEHQFVICNNDLKFPADGLLGIDFLDHHRPILDLNGGLIRLHGTIIPLKVMHPLWIHKPATETPSCRGLQGVFGPRLTLSAIEVPFKIVPIETHLRNPHRFLRFLSCIGDNCSPVKTRIPRVRVRRSPRKRVSQLQRRVELTKVSLLKVNPCLDTRKAEETRPWDIQLVQKRQYVGVDVYTCLIAVQQTIQHCGMHSHSNKVAGGLGKYVLDLSDSECRRAQKFQHLDLRAIGWYGVPAHEKWNDGGFLNSARTTGHRRPLRGNDLHSRRGCLQKRSRLRSYHHQAV